MKISPAQTAKAFIIAAVASFVLAGKIFATASLTLDPTTQTAVKDTPFTTTININVDTQSAFGADAVITYIPSDIDVVSVAAGSFFADFNYANDAANGKLELHGFFSSLYQSKSGSGILASVSWKAKRDTGTGTLGFLCTGSGANTQILNTSGQNILSCTSVNQTTLTYAPNGQQPTATPTTVQPSATPTSTVGAGTPTPTPPPGGNTTPTCTGLTVSMAATSIPITASVTFTCSGNDPDGFISAAQFDFGDRTTQLVEKNAGSPGSISVVHSYPYAASWGVSCKVRDNNNVFSTIPAACQQIIKTVLAPTPTPTTKPPINFNPTPVLVNLTGYTTPTPAPAEGTPAATPAESPKQTNESPIPKLLLFILLVVVALAILWYFLKNSGHSEPLPPAHP